MTNSWKHRVVKHGLGRSTAVKSDTREKRCWADEKMRWRRTADSLCALGEENSCLQERLAEV